MMPSQRETPNAAAPGGAAAPENSGSSSSSKGFRNDTDQENDRSSNNDSNVGQEDDDGGEDKWSLMQQYKSARDEYLRYKLMRSVLALGRTFDGRSFELPPDATADGGPNQQAEQEQQLLRDRRDAVLGEVQETVSRIRQLSVEQQIREATLKTREEELKAMKEDIESKQLKGTIPAADLSDCDMSRSSEMSGYGSGGSVLGGGGDEGKENATEEELAREEERLKSLEERKAYLIQQLEEARDETRRLARETRLQRSKLAPEAQAQQDDDVGTEIDVSEEALQRVKERTVQVQSQIERYEEMHGFYDQLALILQELRGVKVLSVANGNGASGTCACADLVLTMLLLNQYQVEVGLQTVKTTSNKYRRQLGKYLMVGYAKYVANPLQHQQGSEQPQLLLPRLDAIVRMANKASSMNRRAGTSAARGGGVAVANSRNNDSLRYFVSELAMRLANVQARDRELSSLQLLGAVESVRVVYDSAATAPPSQSQDDQANGDGGSSTTSSSSFVGDDQGGTVICTVARADGSATRHAIQVAMRLTPDCPAVDGSVYLEDVVGAFSAADGNIDSAGREDGGAEQQQQRVQAFKESFNHKHLFRRPVDLIQAVLHELTALEGQENSESL